MPVGRSDGYRCGLFRVGGELSKHFCEEDECR